MQVEWKNPPPIEPSRAQEMARALQARPGQWACVAKNFSPFTFPLHVPWWHVLTRSDKIETRRVVSEQSITEGNTGPSARQDIYMRYIENEEARKWLKNT